MSSIFKSIESNRENETYFYFVHAGNTEARGRRRRGQLFPAMIFGIAILGVVTVPIGFHVMSVISGMALLFSKMALLLATITANSKRVIWFCWYRSNSFSKIEFLAFFLLPPATCTRIPCRTLSVWSFLQSRTLGKVRSKKSSHMTHQF